MAVRCEAKRGPKVSPHVGGGRKKSCLVREILRENSRLLPHTDVSNLTEISLASLETRVNLASYPTQT